MKVKYLVGIIGDIDHRRIEAVVFGETLTHKEASSMFGFNRIVGAGFVSIGIGHKFIAPEVSLPCMTVAVYGKSESLEIGTSDLDLEYVKRALGQSEDAKFDAKADYQKALTIIDAIRKARYRPQHL